MEKPRGFFHASAQGEAAAERKPREPQMVTVNGDKVTHGHAYQSNVNPQEIGRASCRERVSFWV